MDPSAFDLLHALRLPDPWQQAALQALRDGRDVILDAPTGAGKTYVFELFAKENKGRRQMVYTVPTRALANDKFLEWRKAGWNVGIATGDVAVALDAPVLVATLETQRERLLRGDGPGLLVVDEYQMVADETRGLNYETAIALAPADTQLLLLSGSVANPDDVAAWLRRLGRAAGLVSSRERPVPLDDLHVAELPRTAPRKVEGFFPRLAYGACLSGLAPLLIFAPQRSVAEKIARQVAAALPDDLPLALPREWGGHCPSDLRALLAKRVAYHHSGLPYPVRAGVVEPLAKNGQLRVVVATMGLAAGINFSVRSVFVSGRSYRDGPFQKQVGPDELLQMFGRAGRRGLDEAGTVLTADSAPCLADASPARLQRSGVLDWPTLLRVMARAADAGQPPFEAARRLAVSLFSPVVPTLGWEGSGAGDEGAASPDADGPLAQAPVVREMLDSGGHWQRMPPAPQQKPLARCLARHRDTWVPALRCAVVLAGRLPGTRPCRLEPGKDPGRWRFGLELTVATRPDPASPWQPTRPVARRLGREPFTAQDWDGRVRKRLLGTMQGAALWEELAWDKTLHVRLDVANLATAAWIDDHGVALVDPPVRERRAGSDTDFVDPATGETRQTIPRSALRAWRRLGLVEADGRPTLRGRIVSFFQRGEGLAVAAALEDRFYPVDDIVWHLANLRGGHRFADTATGESSRLAAACRRAFGSLDFPGYLDLGLPPAYGEGTADHLRRILVDRKPPDVGEGLVRAGDLERARVEWLSLLRHIAHAPPLEWPRWSELQALARHLLDQYGPKDQAWADHLGKVPVLPVPDLTIRKRG